MSEQFTVGTTRRFLAASGEGRKIITNVGVSTLYYGDVSVTSASSTGSLVAGADLVFSAPTYFVSGGTSRVLLDDMDDRAAVAAAARRMVAPTV